MSDMSPREVLVRAIAAALYDGDEEQRYVWVCEKGADAGLAALRAKGWSVVRTEDVRAVVRTTLLALAHGDAMGGHEVLTPEREAATRLEEAIR